MRIEILYVPGCPNYQPAFERLRAVLASEAVQDEIHGVPVSAEAEAKELLFPGSPTIRVNGKDVDPCMTSTPGLACRVYANRSGVPSEEVLRRAVGRAKRESEIRMKAAERATPVAAVIAALSTLACCLPFAFVGALGLAGAGVRIEAFRPWLLASSAVLLGIGFIQLYVRRNQCQKRSTLSIALFWSAAVIVLVVILFPQLIASLIAG